MSDSLPSRQILCLVLAVTCLITSILAVIYRAKELKLAAQYQKLKAEIDDLQPSKALPLATQRNKPSALLDAPITEKTALSFYWFGDMESHFRNPVNFFVVSDGDVKLHKVELTDFITDDQANMFVSSLEMQRILGGLKSLQLDWADLRGREVLKSRNDRKGTDMLDITLLGSDSTGEAHIRIAQMCALLDRLDSTMPTPRILWQFRTFRWDNGCEIPGYENHQVPTE